MAVEWFLGEYHTQLGDMAAIASNGGLALLDFLDRKGIDRQLQKFQDVKRIQPHHHVVLDRLTKELADYFNGGCLVFSLPLESIGSAFERAMWAELQSIPPGETRTYQQIAAALGKPAAARAVGQANARNWRAIVIPCHRLVGSNGSLTGYGGGLQRKHWLLQHEGAKAAAQC